MRQVREILKLRLDVGLSNRIIAKQLGVGGGMRYVEAIAPGRADMADTGYDQ